MSVFRNLLMSLTGGWAGKPADWSDIRKDCPANSIALYAAHSSIYTKVGNPTIENGIASGFSSSNYVQTSNSIDTNYNIVSGFDVQARIKVPSYNSGLAVHYFTGTDGVSSGLNINSVGKVYWIIGRDDTSGTNIGIGGGNTTTIPLDTFYYIRLNILNSIATLYTSIDGISWNTESTLDMTGMVIKTYYDRPFGFGHAGISTNNNYIFNGSIDLNNTYIKVNDEYLTDNSQYDNLGFIANCTGGYNVFIDGTQYGSTYASGAQCNITWSTSGITTGEIITTPSLLKAHKIWIEPATEGANITAFKFQRVADSGSEEQGCLWTHFNIQNQIELTMFGNSVDVMGVGYRNALMKAITAKSNKLSISSLYYAFINLANLEYIPEFVYASNFNILLEGAFDRTSITSLIINNTAVSSLVTTCRYCSELETVKLDNVDLSGLEHASQFIVNSTKLKDTVFDFSSASLLKEIGIYGDSSHFIGGMKGLRVSSSAPFDNSTSPQINVSYTGMDRQALVTLFNDLPTVSAGQIINITGCTGSQQLSDDEIAIAENKGWTVMGGPAYQVYATYNASVGDTIKLNDGMATSDMIWSAYPSDTAITGSYTQTATVTAVGENNIIECNKPTQDNKDVTVNAGEIYYAYTNENDSDDSVYTIDNPISAGTFNLENATNNGCTIDNNLAYGSSNNKIVVNNVANLNTYNSWNFNTKFIYNGGGGGTYGQQVLGVGSGHGIRLGTLTNDRLFCYLSSADGSWTIAGDNTYLNKTLTVGHTYYLKFGYDGTQYYCKCEETPITVETTPIWTLISPLKVNTSSNLWLLNYHYSPYSEWFAGPIYLDETNFVLDGTTTTFGSFSNPSTLYDNTFTALDPQPSFTITSEGISINSVDYDRNSDNDLIKQITSNIEVIDNTTIQTATIISDQIATIETSANITTSNNDNVITDGSYHLFNITIPTGMTPIIESSGISYQTNEKPLLLKSNTGIGLLLKNGNDAYYRNSWVMTRDYDLHYQQINFSYPSGATITCRVNNVLQSDLTPYCYAGDTITWTCDNAGTVTTGSYTVQYSSKDGNIQTIIIS